MVRPFPVKSSTGGWKVRGTKIQIQRRQLLGWRIVGIGAMAFTNTFQGALSLVEERLKHG